MLPSAGGHEGRADAGAYEWRQAVGYGDAVKAEGRVLAQDKGKEIAHEVGGDDGAAHGYKGVA